MWTLFKSFRQRQQGKRPEDDVGAAPAPYPYMDFPALRTEHLTDARLYATRDDLVLALGVPEGAVIGEIGVGLGTMSDFVLRRMRPRQFVAFDTFNLHLQETLWGEPAEKVLEGKTHRAFFEDKVASLGVDLVIEEGLSHTTLGAYPEHVFDLLYIDANHLYEWVKIDAELARTRIKPDGVLVFNDYMMYDHLNHTALGVVPVVNELVVDGGWQVVGFCLQQHMYCDIALRKRQDS